MAHKLLLADDSVTIQRVIELTFADEDVEVTTVGDGQLAIDRLDNDPPDIVLADVDMPKRDGYEIAAYVKSRPKLAHIPVVLLTGAFEPIDAARAAAAGSNDVLAKPFEPQMVINRVKELLTRRSQTAPPIDTPWPRPADVSSHQPPLSQSSALFANPEPTADAAEIVSLDDYFDQLDAAFSNLQAEPAPAPKQADQVEWAAVAIEVPAGAVEVKSEPAAALASAAEGETASLHLDIDESPDFPAEASAFAPPPASEPVSVAAPDHDLAPLMEPATVPLSEPAIAPFSMPTAVPALVATPEPAPGVPAVEMDEPALHAVAQADAPIVPLMAMHAEPPPVPAPKPVAPASPRPVANPFATLSAAKAEAAARPAAPVITDEVIEEVVSRVLLRLSDKIVRETVTEIVSQTAERLVQEEIERIKQAQ